MTQLDRLKTAREKWGPKEGVTTYAVHPGYTHAIVLVLLEEAIERLEKERALELARAL